MQNSAQQPHRYHEFIDGLRAIAIILVLLFHFELLHFPGGFFGVDIFFVISGFLVSGIIFRDLERGQFSIADFYRRRILRIFPALYVSIVLVLALAYFFMLPADAIQTAKSAMASAFFVANHYFFNNLDYFNNSQTGWILLHHWSLSVEEQYYLVFPLAAALLFRSRLSLPHIVSIACVATFLGSLAIFHSDSSAAFYLSVARIWEFLVGVQIAVIAHSTTLRRWQAEAISIVAFALIFIPATVISNPAQLGGLSTVLPVLGAALLIWVNLSPTGTVSNFLLRLPAMRFLGQISYSTYLVHWPVIVFAQYVAILELSVSWRIAMLILSLILGWLGWRFVENPFRNNSTAMKMSGIKFAAFVLLSTMLIVASANWVISQKLQKDALSAEARTALSGETDISPNRKKCHSDEMRRPLALNDSCRLGSDANPVAAVWGDSHGVELAQAVADEMTKHRRPSVLQLTSSSCPPLIDWNSTIQRGCRQRNNDVLVFLRKSSSISHVILAMRYDGYPETDQQAILDALEKTVRLLKKTGKRVIVVGPYPRPEFDIPHGTARATDLWPVVLPEGTERQQHASYTRLTMKRLNAIARKYEVMLIDPAETLCTSQKCPYRQNGRTLYFDDNHPSMAGVSGVAANIVSKIEIDSAR